MKATSKKKELAKKIRAKEAIYGTGTNKNVEGSAHFNK